MKRFSSILALCFLLAASPLWGAASYDTATSQTGTSTSTLTQTHVTAGANTLMVCAVLTWENWASHGTTAATWDYNSVPLVHKVQLQDVGNGSTLDVSYLVAPTTGSNSWTVTLDGSAFDAMTAGCLTFAGVSQVSPLGAEVTNNNGFNNTITIPSGGLGIDFGGDVAGACASTHTVSGTAQTKRFEACADAGGGTTVPLFASTSSNTGSTGLDWITALAEPMAIAIPINQAVAAPTRGRAAPMVLE